jgi:flagellar secretion chaperone FliS
MFAVKNNPIAAYQRVGVETGVGSADPHKLIVMLFEGARLAVAEAALFMQQKEIAMKGKSISKAIMIIDHGLKASLDIKAGGEMAEQLAALYDYMTHRLSVANLHNDVRILEEIDHLLADLQSAWNAIGTTQSAPTDNAQSDKRLGLIKA